MRKKNVKLSEKFKRKFCLLMVHIMLIGNIVSGLPATTLLAHEETITTEEDKSEWYVLGRPMTEEEEQEQLDIIAYYDGR